LTNNTGRCGGSTNRRPSGENSDTIHHILAPRRQPCHPHIARHP
jgi:hypothetical protein